MRKTLALVVMLSLVAIVALPAAGQPQAWKPEIKFLKIGVSSAGGDWFRAGAKFSTLIPSALPDVASSTVIGGGVVNVTRIGKGEAQMAFALRLTLCARWPAKSSVQSWFSGSKPFSLRYSAHCSSCFQ